MVCIVFTYFPAVAVDRVLVMRDEVSVAVFENLREIEKYRQKVEDIPARQRLLDSDYEPLFKPTFVRTDIESRFTELATQHGVGPLAPQPNTSVYFCNEGYGLVSYVSDRFGFRNEDVVWDKNPQLFIIGDSFAQGACVPDNDKTIVGHLNAYRPTVSLGTGGNGAIHYAALIKVLVPHFEPQGVVLVFYANDNEQAIHENEGSYFYKYFWSGDYPPYLRSIDGALSLGESLDNFYEEVRSLLREEVSNQSYGDATDLPAPAHYSLNVDEVKAKVSQQVNFFSGLSEDNFYLSKLRSTIRSFLGSPAGDLNFSSRLAIDELHSACARACKRLVVYIPNSDFWRPDYRSRSYRDALRNYAKFRGLKFIDTSDVLRKAGDVVAFSPRGPHLSPYGYEIVAQEIRFTLEQM